uniref:Methyltransferase domain-containing protein n=1 Tax=Plectus sambesii TaxID=2011161 RepID=A0A914UV63_9BILA
GLGHLSRLLSIHGHDAGLQVQTIDADAAFVRRAQQLDAKLARMRRSSSEWSAPQRHTKWIRQGDTLIDVDDQLRSCLIGLHACGDLSSALLREFSTNESVVAVVSVGCCYHKLNGGRDKEHMQVWSESDDSLKEEDSSGFPMSDAFRRLDVRLSFAARELACHAIEQYADRMHSDPLALKVHCYRAALEWLITRRFPDKRHEGLRSVKRAADMDFWQYAKLALDKRPDLQPALEAAESDPDCVTAVNGLLVHWPRVVSFYCLRTMLAPLIESMILTDRAICLSELGHSATLVPLFDARVSPRNLALIAYKTNL